MSSLEFVNPSVKGIRVSSHSELQSMAAQMKKGPLKPLTDIIDVSSGDLHGAGMKPVSFLRQVLAACLHPELLKDENLPLDVRLRAQRFLEVCDGGSMGSYTASSGMWYIRKNIAEFITRRDAGVPSYAQDVFIAGGSQKALRVILKLISSVEGETQTGMLTPVPCPHSLPLLLDEGRVTLEPYRLVEERGWAVDLVELQQALKTARGRCNPRAIYISNPGNPTGHVQDRKSIQEVIQFAAAERLLLLVDEVNQDCVFGADREFISYKRVLFEMGEEFSQTVELVSFHSLSTACIGECGLRTGYMELINIDPGVKHFVNTCLCTYICAPVPGQLALDLMVDPPNPGDPSYDIYRQELLLTQTTLSQNARRAQEFLNDLPGMSCEPAMGGIYLYPRLCLPPEIIKQAEMLEMEADVLYCQSLLKEEGVLVGAGSQNQETSTKYHLRLCFHVSPATLEDVLARLASFHLRLMDALPWQERGVKDSDVRGKYKEDIMVHLS